MRNRIDDAVLASIGSDYGPERVFITKILTLIARQCFLRFLCVVGI